MAANLGKPYDFNSYAAGNKVYGGGRSAPNYGPVDKLGYRERDAAVKLKRNAMLRRLKANLKQNYMNQNSLGGPRA